jgi:hypothetical protein
MGGQATNSGIDYQQRIAAWCLINQYTEFDVSTYFDQIDEKLVIDKIHFETDKPIDDINLLCKNNKKVFLQIKRSLSLSVRENSDFYKTILQFVKEFIKSEFEDTFYGIITTSDASSKITNDLKKFVLSAKLNTDFLTSNPLNESEKECLEKINILFNQLYLIEKKQNANEEKFKSFLKKIFIGVIDVETGHTVEIASFMLLRSVGFKNPEIIWSILIKNSLLYSSQRLSLDRTKLIEIFNRYLENNGKSKEEIGVDLFKTQIISQGEFSTAKEVLIIESIYQEFEIMIVELYRFKEDCSIKNKFKNNELLLENSDNWKVIQRFSTRIGLDRFLDENKELYIDKKIAIIPALDTETIEETQCAILHKAFLEDLVSKNLNPLTCLHCGKGINEKNALLVELDDDETIPAVGNVHKKCLRALDRILGTIIIPREETSTNLESFDFKLWVSLIMKGQGLMNSIKSSSDFFQGRTPLIAWNSDEEYDADYSYCIKFNLEDNSTSYCYRRSQIERINKFKAEQYILKFEEIQKRQKELNDPYSVLSISKTAGPYSELIKIKKAEEVVLEIKSVEIAKYSIQIAKAFDKDIVHYAPLCLIRNRDSETILNLSNVLPILSDPLKVDEYYANWKDLGFELENLELKIIKSDKDFDYYMRQFFGDGLTPIIDPIFDKNFNLIKGFPINELNQIKERQKNESR